MPCMPRKSCAPQHIVTRSRRRLRHLLEIANRPNVTRDADSLLKYFAVAPEARSTQHDHMGSCTNVPLTIIARP